MNKPETELQTFLQSGKTKMYRHGNKNRVSPVMRVLKHMATGLALTAGVGCSNISQVSQSQFEQMTDKVHDTINQTHEHKTHLLSLSQFDRYKNMHLTMENAEQFKTDVEKETGAKFRSNYIAIAGYSSFYSGMPIALSLMSKTHDEKECLVIPMDNNNTQQIIHKFLEGSAQQYRPAFENMNEAVFQDFTNYHEAWHCSFFANLEKHLDKHNVPKEDDTTAFAIKHYVTHIGEVLSDVAAIAEIIHDQKTSDTTELRNFAHMRNLHVAQGHLVFSSADTPTASYYTAPAIHAMIDLIEEKGVQNFQKLSNQEVIQTILDVAAENTLKYDNFKELWAYTSTPKQQAETNFTDKINNNKLTPAQIETIAGFKRNMHQSVAFAQSKMPKTSKPITLAQKPQ